jgi:hypothetical protein
VCWLFVRFAAAYKEIGTQSSDPVVPVADTSYVPIDSPSTLIL